MIDSDCGKLTGACERVISGDHFKSKCGQSVTETTAFDGVRTVFNDNYTFVSLNSPHSVILNDKKLNISVGRYFEDRDSIFFLHKFNSASWSRTLLFAGITILRTPLPTRC